MNHHLGKLVEIASVRGWPMLSAVVVNQGNIDTGKLDGTAREGFLAAAREFGFNVADPAAFVEEQQQGMFAWAPDAPDELVLGDVDQPSENLSPGEQITRNAGRGKTDSPSNRRKRLAAAEFQRISADYIWRAVQRLLSRSGEHSFGRSTGYDVIADDGSRLPPKAVFGLAASEALGFEVLPHHIVGGIGTPCFKAITAAGYLIAPKNTLVKSDEAPPNPDDLKWVEGHPRLVTHLRRERGSGLAPAKKAVFIREHGRLLCERCGLDPAEVYGFDIGDACIEVHHKLPLADMQPGHNTQLEDLLCLCANCHRIIHRELRNAD